MCPEDFERNQYPRPLARRAARGITQFEHTADEIVGQLKETELKIQNMTGSQIEKSEIIPSDVTGAEVEKSKFALNDVTDEGVESSKLFRTRRRLPKLTLTRVTVPTAHLRTG